VKPRRGGRGGKGVVKVQRKGSLGQMTEETVKYGMPVIIIGECLTVDW
jgi:hypothetical protein